MGRFLGLEQLEVIDTAAQALDVRTHCRATNLSTLQIVNSGADRTPILLLDRNEFTENEIVKNSAVTGAHHFDLSVRHTKACPLQYSNNRTDNLRCGISRKSEVVNPT